MAAYILLKMNTATRLTSTISISKIPSLPRNSKPRKITYSKRLSLRMKRRI
jgi:hypothetical protein